jgi:hypothetical protein
MDYGKFLNLFRLTTPTKAKGIVGPEVLSLRPDDGDRCPHCNNTWCTDREEQMI